MSTLRPITVPALAQARVNAVAAQARVLGGDCVFVKDACCKLMSTGIYRCSWPDLPGRPGTRGACTPGLETCPRWLTDELRRDTVALARARAAVPKIGPARLAIRRGVAYLRARARGRI